MDKGPLHRKRGERGGKRDGRVEWRSRGNGLGKWGGRGLTEEERRRGKDGELCPPTFKKLPPPVVTDKN